MGLKLSPWAASSMAFTPPRAVDATRTVLLAKECCGN